MCGDEIMNDFAIIYLNSFLVKSFMPNEGYENLKFI